MPKISVIFVTNRKGFAEILFDDLARQTFKDFEIIVADENIDPSLATDKWFKPRQKNEGDAWNLNKAYNDCLDRATGELLVFLQDFIWIPDDGLQRFWDDYQKMPNAFIAGVGHKALHGLEGISEVDRRMESPHKGLTLCDHWQIPWEMNWACAPRKIMPRFDERMDAWYGGENLYISHKAFLAGADIAIDRDNVCIAYSQAECGGRPADWEERHCNKDGRLAAFIKALDVMHDAGVQ